MSSFKIIPFSQITSYADDLTIKLLYKIHFFPMYCIRKNYVKKNYCYFKNNFVPFGQFS